MDDNIEQFNKRYKIEPKTRTTPQEIDFEKLRPCFGWLGNRIIRKTLENTTQLAKCTVRFPLRHHFKSRFPALNVRRRSEPVATDTFYSDVPAFQSKVKHAQVFVGRHTQLTDIEPMKHKSDFTKALENNIRKRGAMDLLISDRAKEEISKTAGELTRLYRIAVYQSEPHHQHQNFAENRMGTLKDMTNRILDRSGMASMFWLLCLIYVSGLLNVLAHKGLNYKTPLEKAEGITPDVSMYMQFHFGQKVYYSVNNTFPATTEKTGRWVGIAENVGDALTWQILTDDTNQIIMRSAVRPVDENNLNNRLRDGFGLEDDDDEPREEADIAGDDKDTTNYNAKIDRVIKSKVPYHPDKQVKGPSLDADAIVGRSLLLKKNKHGTRYRAKIIKKIVEMENNAEKIKFLASVPENDQESILEYHELMELVEDQWGNEDSAATLWSFRKITGHEGPLKKGHPSFLGSLYNVLVEWEDGSITSEPLKIFAKDDFASCADYAKKNNLCYTDGWKQFRKMAYNVKMLRRQLNQAKLRSYNDEEKYMFGVLIPKTYRRALELDKENGNTYWADASKKEIEQLMEYKSYKDIGRNKNAPPEHQMIRCHMIFACKHDGRRKARYVAGGHMTDPPLHSVYSGVVSLRSVRLLCFVAELNKLELWAADVTCAYLEAKCAEKLCFRAGKEFEPFNLDGHTLVLAKAVYGTKSAGRAWNERLAEVLTAMGYTRSKADKEIWMKDMLDHYEYIGCYVDDLLIVSKEPEKVLDILRNTHKFHLKGDGQLTYHLGCDYERDPDGTLFYSPKKYIQRIIQNYEKIFALPKFKPKTPLDTNDHPETDTSAFCDGKETQLYWSLIGSFQWLISLGRFDIQTATMTLSGFRCKPRKGHLERAKRVLCYIKHMNYAAIRIRTGFPTFPTLKHVQYDWMNEVYGNSKEVKPTDAPIARGEVVRTITYYDANLVHDYLSGRSVSGILHLINQTPFQWYCSKQATVETSTYGSEFVAAKIATDQLVDIRLTLRYMGIKIEPHGYMFGDNKSVVTQSTLPHSQLTKRHHLYSYHRVREAVAAGFLRMFHIPGTDNPADVLSKHAGAPQSWPILKYLLFWRGDPDSDSQSSTTKKKKKKSMKVNKARTRVTRLRVKK